MTTEHNKAALVTGGSRGIGYGIAEELATSGWNLAINGMRPEADVAQPLDDLRRRGVEVAYCRGDVSSAAARSRILEEVRAKFDRLDLLLSLIHISEPTRQ